MIVYVFGFIVLFAFAIFCFFMHRKESNKRRLHSNRQRYRLGKKSA